MNEEYRNLIREITESVMKKIGNSADAGLQIDGETGRTVVITSSYVSNADNIKKYLNVEFGKYVLVSSNNKDTSIGKPMMALTDETESQVADLVNKCDSLVLVMPRIYQIRGIADGYDRGLLEYIAANALMWGKRISVLLDVQPPILKNNRFHTLILETAGKLRDMGITVLERVTAASKEAADAKRGLITEEDVLQAKQRNQSVIRVNANTIITPLARDTANEIGITIEA